MSSQGDGSLGEYTSAVIGLTGGPSLLGAIEPGASLALGRLGTSEGMGHGAPAVIEEHRQSRLAHGSSRTTRVGNAEEGYQRTVTVGG